MTTQKAVEARRRSRFLTALLGAVVVLWTATALPAHALPAQADDGVTAALDEYVAEVRPPGVALVTMHDGEVTTQVRGVDGEGQAVSADTPFRIASMSKAFTALAIMQQVDAGRLALDDRVADVLPELELADERYRSITLRHLLSHTSGISAAGLEYGTDPEIGAAEFVALFADEELVAAPGTRTLYSNAAYKVLARVVEVTAGAEFNDYVAQEILAPLGMGSTTITSRCDGPAAGLTNGYVMVLGARVAVPETPISCLGDGGVVTTAADMATWLEFQLGDGTSPVTGERVVSAASLAAMHDVPAEPDEYALGWSNSSVSTEGALWVGHGGDLATSSSYIEFSPATGTGAVALTNAAGVPVVLTHNAITAYDGGPHETPSMFLDTLNVVLISLSALVLVLSGLVAWRSGRWAVRRRTSPRWAIALRLSPLATLALLGASLPLLVGASIGLADPVAYLLIAWMFPMGVLLALSLLLGCGTALVLRLVRLRRVRRAVGTSARRSGGSPLRA